MILKKLQLKNFRCFEDIEVVFHDQLSVIVGVNGAGKTSIMEGVAIAISTMFVPLSGTKGLGIDKAQAHLKAYKMGSVGDVQPQYPVSVSADAICDGQKIHWERALNTEKGSTTIKDAKSIVEIATEYQERLRKGDQTLILPILAYYGTGRLWDYHREKQSDVFESNNRLNGYVDCVDGTANIKLMMNWFSKMTIQKYQNQELGLENIPELEAVYAAMETCFARITGYKTVKIQYSMGTKELEVAYKDELGNMMRIPINQLSDGYKSTISLVADIAYRMAVLNPQLLGDVCQKTSGIVVIDEIDLHLHPSWQQRILGDLTAIFPKVQFIVSTHAPAVISSVKSENIVLLDDGQVFEPSGEVHGKDVNTIISSVMNTAERPPEIKALFNDFYRMIDAGKVQTAEEKLNDLEERLNGDDPELAGCRVKLKLQKARWAR
jgi:predicted ATP-binding protein involved in virulence